MRMAEYVKFISAMRHAWCDIVDLVLQKSKKRIGKKGRKETSGCCFARGGQFVINSEFRFHAVLDQDAIKVPGGIRETVQENRSHNFAIILSSSRIQRGSHASVNNPSISLECSVGDASVSDSLTVARQLYIGSGVEVGSK